MTERERICLTYMEPLMWATPSQVGLEIYTKTSKINGSNLSGIGSAVLGRLRKRGLVAYLPDCQAWRITKAGRAALAAPERETDNG